MDMLIATLNAKDFELIDGFFPLPGVYNPANDVWAVQRFQVESAEDAMHLIMVIASTPNPELGKRYTAQVVSAGCRILFPLFSLRLGHHGRETFLHVPFQTSR